MSRREKLSGIREKRKIKISSKGLIPMRVAGLCGVMTPIIIFTCIGLAISYSPWFTWTGSFLSDLAGMVGDRPIWSARGIASVLFNVGVIISGFMGCIFAIAVRRIRMLNTRLGRFGTRFLLLDMAALCAVGIFPETTGYPHTVVSLAFFFLIPVALIPIGTVMRKTSEKTGWPEKTAGWFITILGLIALFSSLLLVPLPPSWSWGGNAIVEMIPSVLISVLATVFGIIFLISGFEISPNNG